MIPYDDDRFGEELMKDIRTDRGRKVKAEKAVVHVHDIPMPEPVWVRGVNGAVFPAWRFAVAGGFERITDAEGALINPSSVHQTYDQARRAMITEMRALIARETQHLGGKTPRSREFLAYRARLVELEAEGT